MALIFAEPGFPKNGSGILDPSMPEASVTRIVRVTSAELEETSTLVGEGVIPSGNSGLSSSGAGAGVGAGVGAGAVVLPSDLYTYQTSPDALPLTSVEVLSPVY